MVEDAKKRRSSADAVVPQPAASSGNQYRAADHPVIDLIMPIGMGSAVDCVTAQSGQDENDLRFIIAMVEPDTSWSCAA